MGVILVKAIQLLLSLTILVFVHELGHYIFARLFKIRVDKFFLFFDIGFEFFKFKPKGSDTTFGMGWLPLGGYCKINGMIDESMDTDFIESEPKPYEFRSKPAWQRFLVMFAGVFFNAILAWGIYSSVLLAWGTETLYADQLRSGMAFSSVAKEIGFEDNDVILRVDGKRINVLDRAFSRKLINAHQVEVLRNGQQHQIDMPANMMSRLIKSKGGFLSLQMPMVIDSALAGTPASMVGLMPGDSVTHVAGVQTPDFNDVMAALQQAKGDTATIQLSRRGQSLSIAIPVDTLGKIGVQMKGLDQIYQLNRHKYSLLEAIPAGFATGYYTLTGYVSDMKYVFTREGASQIGGFGTLGKLFPSRWVWKEFWNMTAFLSIILAVMNLLPIPALDGGHILFILVEIVTGRKPSPKALMTAQLIGMILLVSLLLYANGNDLVRAITG